MRQVQVSSQEAYTLLSTIQNKPNFSFFTNSLSEGPILVMELVGAEAQQKWISIIGQSGNFLIFYLYAVNSAFGSIYFYKTKNLPKLILNKKMTYLKLQL